MIEFNIRETLWEPEDSPLMAMLSQEPQLHSTSNKITAKRPSAGNMARQGVEDRHSNLEIKKTLTRALKPKNYAVYY